MLGKPSTVGNMRKGVVNKTFELLAQYRTFHEERTFLLLVNFNTKKKVGHSIVSSK
jgi:hypothetical protein